MPATPSPRTLLILDRRPEYARLLAALAATDDPTLPIATFDDLGDAGRWISRAQHPLLMLVDVTAAGGDALVAAESWRRERADATLIALFDAHDEVQAQRASLAVTDAAFEKPCCRAEWRKSVGALLRTEQLATPA